MGTLFATTVANAKPRDRDYKLSDGRGLYLLVRPNGSKLWRFNYRYFEKHRTLAFGAWPDVGLADARSRRDEARQLIAAGLDPSHERKVLMAKARVAENDTFKSVAKEWIDKNEREGMAEITLSKIRWLLDKAYPKIGARPISKITAHEVLVVLRSVEATGRYESARRMRSVVGRVFRYAVATTRAERDPTSDLRGALTVPKPKHLAAITTANRAGELMRAIEGYTGHAITLFGLRLSAHLFVRPGELRQAEWSEFDFDRSVWNIPAEKMKMRRASKNEIHRPWSNRQHSGPPWRMDVRQRLAVNMKRLRKERGWSQEALADEARLDRTYISGIERVVKNPTITVVERIASALGCTLGSLLD